MLKLNENPPIIFPENKSVEQLTGTWRVAHTKSRNEKALAWDLLNKNISYFLPLTTKVSKTPKGRTIRSLAPLFSGYLFFCGDDNARTQTLKTNRVANIIESRDQKTLINQLSAIQRAIQSGANLKPFNLIKPGRKCRVIAGPLIGAEGTVIKTMKETRLILQVEMLGQATSINIESDLLEIIE